jgi:glyoxylase-like metal-dependent hydrolase (beta-lactamase superfamily II)
MDIPFKRDFDVPYGIAERVAPRIRRVVARNPSAFTFRGTGTYIVGEGRVAVIDPGPALPEHLHALERALAGEEITHLVVTHTHLDHSPLSRALQAYAGAPTYGFGPHRRADATSGEPVEEGADFDFEPDVVVRGGDVVEGDGWSLECVHTPGHTSNHVCYQLREEKALFSGDHVMGWSTSVISPPDGDMSEYMRSLALLLERDDRVYWPTHGPAIEDPKPFVRAFVAHRRRREEEILGCVREGRRRIREMVPRIYPEVPAELRGAAARQVLAVILHLHAEGRIGCEGEPGIDAAFTTR